MTLRRRFPARKSKYNAVKTDGYDSKKEAGRAAVLKMWQQAGIISELEEQVKYELVPKQDGERAVNYICDFRYRKDGEIVVEDVKSAFTRKLPVYAIKRKLMQYIHGIRISEV